MKNFDFDRFKMFGRYDLTINKAFYRNMVLTVLGGSLGILSLCFLARFSMWKAFDLTMGDEDYVVQSGFPFEHYSSQYITVILLAGFFVLMLTIFGGCWAHNLRNRQGRIMELMLPATNLEKFVWHVALVTIGGFAVVVASLLVCDLANYLLAVAFFPDVTAVPSIMLQFISFGLFTIYEDVNAVISAEILYSFRFLIWSSLYMSPCIYILGNAIKYKYNIILTYVACFVIENVFSISIFASLINMKDYVDAASRELDIVDAVTNSMYTFAGFEILVGTVCLFVAYHLYTKAQFTTSWNK